MNKSFLVKMNENKEIIDNNIINYFKGNKLFTEVLNYAISDGKRIRPILFMETYKLFKPLDDIAIQFALSLEFIHNYSLVHDDLPALDNDNFRRDKPTVHHKYSENLAILCGDALLNHAYENIFQLLVDNPNDEKLIKSAEQLSFLAGYEGMINGQIMDLYKNVKTKEDLFLIYEKKTCNLFIAAMKCAGLIGRADDDKLEYLVNYAYNLGICFQLTDDLLESNYEDELNVLNFIQKDEALNLLQEYATRCKDIIKHFDNSEFFFDLVDYMVERDY